MTRRVTASFLVFLLGVSLFLHGEAAPKPVETNSDDKDLCSYLKDVELKTDADCSQDTLAALKSNNPAAFSQKLRAAKKRKPDVLKAYEFLKAQPSLDQHTPPQTNGESQHLPIQLQPPINERTFPAWVGPEAKDLKDVYTRLLQARNRELQREQKAQASPERGKEIDTVLAANQAKIAGLQKLKDPSRFGCYLGESCGGTGNVTDPASQVQRTGKGTWTKADYDHANAEIKRQNFVPGGKLDRGMPDLKGVASEVVANSPLGPLAQKPAGNNNSPMGTAAELALLTSGGLLLFGGLGGKKLEEKIPGIRKGMVIGAGILGVSVAGGWALSEISLPALTLPPPPVPQLALAGGGSMGGGSAAGIEGSVVMNGVRTLAKIGATVIGAKVAGSLALMKSEAGKENTETPRTGQDLKKQWGNPDTLQDHFERHGPDFGAKSPADYVQKAADFFKKAGQERLPRKVDDQGVMRIYDPKTNAFGSYNPNGSVKTYYKPNPAVHGKPTNLDYWAKQPGKLL